MIASWCISSEQNFAYFIRNASIVYAGERMSYRAVRIPLNLSVPMYHGRKTGLRCGAVRNTHTCIWRFAAAGASR